MVVNEHRAWKKIRKWAAAYNPKLTHAELSTVTDTLIWLEKARKSVFNLVTKDRSVENSLLVIDAILQKVDEYLLTDEGYARHHIVLTENQLKVLDFYVKEKNWGAKNFYQLLRQWFIALSEIRTQITERIRAGK